MCNAVIVQIVNTLNKLLEETISVDSTVWLLEVAFVDQAEEIALTAILHDMVPPSMMCT